MNGAPAKGKFRPCALEHLPHHCEENEIVVQREAGQLPGSSAHRAAKPAVIRLVELMLTHAQLRVGGLYIAEQASPSSVFIFINIINRRTRYYNKLSVNILNRRECGGDSLLFAAPRKYGAGSESPKQITVCREYAALHRGAFTKSAFAVPPLQTLPAARYPAFGKSPFPSDPLFSHDFKLFSEKVLTKCRKHGIIFERLRYAGVVQW